MKMNTAKEQVAIEFFCFMLLTTTATQYSFAEDSGILSRVASAEKVLKAVQNENEILRKENQQMKRELVMTQSRLDEVEEDTRILKHAHLSLFLDNDNNNTTSQPEPGNQQDMSDARETPMISVNRVKHKYQSKNMFNFSRISEVIGTKMDLTNRRRIQKRAASSSGNKISFSAHLTKHLTGLGNQEAFVFDTVNNNEGNSYDNVSGMFICPIPGTYFFTVSILAWHQEMLEAQLVLNGTPKARIYAAGSTGSHGYDQGSNSAILSCKQGDHVWVKHVPLAGTRVTGDLYSHFAGFLLWTA